MLLIFFSPNKMDQLALNFPNLLNIAPEVQATAA